MSADLSTFRNIAFVGHPGSGKTTLVDAMAHELGASDRKGSVGDKTSICDTEPEEQERQGTLQLASVHAEHDGLVWNLIDTPGYPEFVTDTRSAIFAAELTVGVVSCSSGVTFNLRQKMEVAQREGRARAIVVTHADGDNADFDELVEELRSSIGAECVPVLVPDQSGSGFSSVAAPCDGPDSDWHKRLNDRVMDACEDEDVLMEYLENEELSPEMLAQHAPIAIAAGALIPVLMCNPDTGVGVSEVIAYLSHFAPSPAVRSFFATGGEEILCDPTGDLQAVVFNVKSDPHVGKICLARVLRGTLHSSDIVGEAKGEKLGGLFHAVGGKNRTTADSVSAGDIAAFSKVEKIGWGASFSTAGTEVKAVDVPVLQNPMVALAITPKSRSDEQKIGQALSKLEAEDPSFRVEHVQLTHELVIHGMSDLHLQIMEQRLKRRYGVEIDSTLPRIAYRETVTRPANGHHRHKKQTGGRGQFGECYIRIKPGEEGTGIVFLDKVVGGSIPKNLIPAIDKGIREVSAEGILTDSIVVDVEIEVYDGKFHAVDSDEASFKKAGANAFREAFRDAGPVLLEPMMALEIRVPSDDAGTIFSDITSQRRGTVVDQTSEADGAITVICAHVPLATIQTYHRDLKSQTAGEGGYAMDFQAYTRVPAGEQQKVVADKARQAEAE
jgi:elongation factor G